MRRGELAREGGPVYALGVRAIALAASAQRDRAAIGGAVRVRPWAMVVDLGRPVYSFSRTALRHGVDRPGCRRERVVVGLDA